MITGGDLRQSRLDVGYKTFTISPWDKLPILNGAFDGYISEKELEILSQYELTKLGFKLLEEKNTNADGYLDPEKMPAFFQQLYKSIDKDGKMASIAPKLLRRSKINQSVINWLN